MALSLAVPTALLVLLLARPVRSQTEVGGIVEGGEVWKQDKSPYTASKDVIVRETGVLTIQPGVEVRFAAGVGLIVYGTLRAQGTEFRRILLTRAKGKLSLVTDTPADIRLSEGSSILEGRLQLYYKGKWRSVCTGSRNWTEEDYRIACRQLGFADGEFFQWYEHRNDSNQLLYMSPDCVGNETSLFQCNWASQKMGSGVCDYYQDIGIRCYPSPIGSHQWNWNGIYFHFSKSQSKVLYATDDYAVTKVTVSDSILQNVDILFAGYNKTGVVSSAINILGVPPIIDTVNIHMSSYNGINITHPRTRVDILNSDISHNRGHGIVINSSLGDVFIKDTVVSNNGGDGIRFIRNNNVQLPSGAFDFCKGADLGVNQVYPVWLTVHQFHKGVSVNCSRVFKTSPDQILTLHLLYIESIESEVGRIMIKNGDTLNSPILAEFPISNSSRPHSISTTGDVMGIHIEAQPKAKLLLTMKLDSSFSKAYDVNISGSTVNNNFGSGVAVYDMLSLVHVINSEISNNSEGGVQILGGSGDVNFTENVLTDNGDTAVKVISDGGRSNFSNCNISNNNGHGVIVEVLDSQGFKKVHQKTTVVSSYFSNNLKTDVFIGRYCGVSLVNVTMNTFENCSDKVLIFDSCPSKDVQMNKLFITNNKFLKNRRLSVQVMPALNIDAIIEHNYFFENMAECLLIKASNKDSFYEIPAKVLVQENVFRNNINGAFVANVGLIQGSEVQSLFFTHNWIKFNIVKESFPNLNPRSCVSAVVTVSSSNVQIYRNILLNPSSEYEIGCHLDDRHNIINATYNFLGSTEQEKNHQRVFDQKNRYNLAEIQIQPFLLVESDPNTDIVSDDRVPYIPTFHTPNKFEIGGEVMGKVVLQKGTYIVTRDIYVRPRSLLEISESTVLKFQNSLGIMIQGKLKCDGKNVEKQNGIYFTLSNDFKSQISSPNIRLIGGTSNEFYEEGRLLIKDNEEWGTVCDYGWTVQSAAIACHQLGLVLNPDDWKVNSHELSSDDATRRILLSNVKCQYLDNDITKCKAERSSDFENSCTHENDVALRCYKPSWAGLRFGSLAEESELKFFHIEHAGLLDYHSKHFQAAIQMDLAHHILDHVYIENNLYTGLDTIFNNIYHISTRYGVFQCQINKNFGYGIRTKMPGLTISKTMIRDNLKSGLHLDSSLSSRNQKDVAKWITKADSTRVIYLNNQNKIVTLKRGDSFFIVTPRQKQSIENVFETTEDNVFGIQILNPPSLYSTEEILIYQEQESKNLSDAWNLKKLLNIFPTISKGSTLVIKYKGGKQPLGGVILLITAIERNFVRYPPPGPVPILKIESSELSNNDVGLSISHYNEDFINNAQWNIRIWNEILQISGSSFSGNKHGSINSELRHNLNPCDNFSKTTLVISNCIFTDNGNVITLVSANKHQMCKIYNWTIVGNYFSHNDAGGLRLFLPNVKRHLKDTFHTVIVKNNTFNDNKDFFLQMDGHFAQISIKENHFLDNLCYKGLLSFDGKEKETWIERNEILRNTGKYIVDFNIKSQSDLKGVISAYIKNNVIENNSPDNSVSCYDNGPTCYTVGIHGLQKVNMTNNIFEQNMFPYEFLSAVQTNSINNYINVRENWWNTINPEEIRKRIFDFEDWNNYAIAEYIPFLMEKNIVSLSLSEPSIPVAINYNNLGGRIYGSVHLAKRPEPYNVNSDLTVMPSSLLTIDAGVTMRFRPNVGILVLGTLQILGTAEERVVLKLQNTATLPKKLSLNKILVRLCTNASCHGSNEGFLETFNLTTNQWIPLCDNTFTEQNAEVICHELGFSKHSAILKHGNRFDLKPFYLSRLKSWPLRRRCSGNEDSYEKCVTENKFPPNTCSIKSNFVFIHCGFEVQHQSWGGITFSVSDYEHSTLMQQNSQSTGMTSVIEYVDIINAGNLHNQKSAGLQAVFKIPKSMKNLKIADSVSHGISLINPVGDFSISNAEISNNLGFGINIVNLHGDTRNSNTSSFDPLQSINIPYHIFGMVDVCGPEKYLTIYNRVLLYYKYHPEDRVCIKVFKASRTIAFRLLQIHLFNDTNVEDVIHIYDGDVYNNTHEYLGNITHNLYERRNLFRSTGLSLSVHIEASAGSQSMGFVAEVLTFPPNYDFEIQTLHNLTENIISSNFLGGLSYSSVGEISPSISITENHFSQNNRKLFGNFTASNAAITLDIQNTRHLTFKNNAVVNNRGGLSVVAGSETKASALQADIVNNLFTKNENRPTLGIKGLKMIPYQVFSIKDNIITHNLVPLANIVQLDKVFVDFKSNYLHNNSGQFILSSSFDKSQLKGVSLQVFSNNTFHNNTSFHPKYSSTLVSSSTDQQYHWNVFWNPNNNFEMTTENFPGGLINASFNWWNYNKSIAISARIHDGRDEKNLITVDYEPFLTSKNSVIKGSCPPGWFSINAGCYLYIGGIMTSDEAKDYCKKENSSLAFVKSHDVKDFAEVIRKLQFPYSNPGPVRVHQVGFLSSTECSSITGDILVKTSCNTRHPFICQRGSSSTLTDEMEFNMAIVVGVAGGFGALVVFVCILFCICRARYRKKTQDKYSPTKRQKSLSNNHMSTDDLNYSPFVQSKYENNEGAKPRSQLTTTFIPLKPINHHQEEDNEPSIDEDKKSLSQETLPLMDKSEEYMIIDVKPRRYLETSLDNIDTSTKYLETFLDEDC